MMNGYHDDEDHHSDLDDHEVDDLGDDGHDADHDDGLQEKGEKMDLVPR